MAQTSSVKPRDKGRILFLQKVIAIQNCFREEKPEGMTTIYFYNNYIRPTYFISYTTFYRYLGMNARRELTNINEKLKEEPCAQSV